MNRKLNNIVITEYNSVNSRVFDTPCIYWYM